MLTHSFYYRFAIAKVKYRSNKEPLKSEYHESDPLRPWQPQKMAESRVYMSDL